jgi:mannose-6-phosphate isomerase-like protein (cupin superfamily)
MSDYTIIKLDDAPNFMGDAGEMRPCSQSLETEQLALTYIRIPPGTPLAPPDYSPAFGHHHKTQEEIYYVLSGTATLKLDDDVVEIGPRGAVRMAPATKRSVRNLGDDDLEMLLLSAKVDDLREEVVIHEDFWPS